MDYDVSAGSKFSRTYFFCADRKSQKAAIRYRVSMKKLDFCEKRSSGKKQFMNYAVLSGWLLLTVLLRHKGTLLWNSDDQYKKFVGKN